jgi:hypothetical protein
MHSISDERNWLTWLVKVRLLILTVLLAIELAVIRLTPSPVPILPFLTAMVLWFVLSLFFLFLVSVWTESRLQAMLQVLSDLAMVTLVVHLTAASTVRSTFSIHSSSSLPACCCPVLGISAVRWHSFCSNDLNWITTG